jgi:fermentation-respiration switch protein FrsA (DUF1100 family)
VILSLIGALCLIYVLLCVLFYLMQDKIIFLPTREIEQTPAAIGLRFEDVTLTTPDGLRISAWYIPAPEARATLLFCHGNAGNISHRLDSIRIFHNRGLNVLIFDYRGYGTSEGSPDEKGTYRDAETAWTYLISEKHADPNRIVLFGRSLGGGVAAEMAKRHRAGALILESTFTSVADIGRKLYPFLPVAFFVKHEYATGDKIGAIDIPKLIIHSPQDEIIPFSHGMALYEMAAPPKKLMRISGDHNTGFLTSGALYSDGLDAFLSKHVH